MPSWPLPVVHPAQKSISDCSDGRCSFRRAQKLGHAPQHSPSSQRCWRMHPCLPLAGSSYRAVVPEFVKPIFEPVLHLLPGSGAVSFGSSLPAVGRGALQSVEGAFSIKDVWEWDLLGSLTSNDQQFRMKLLSLCSGLHEKNPHKVLASL